MRLANGERSGVIHDAPRGGASSRRPFPHPQLILCPANDVVAASFMTPVSRIGRAGQGVKVTYRSWVFNFTIAPAHLTRTSPLLLAFHRPTNWIINNVLANTIQITRPTNNVIVKVILPHELSHIEHANQAR